MKTPHKDKLMAALANPKAKADENLLKEALKNYKFWINSTQTLSSNGAVRIKEMVGLLNQYKDLIEVELITRKGSAFLKRQRGQLKLDSSIMEEFLIHLLHPDILTNLPDFELDTGPQTAFMSLSFRPSSVQNLNEKPVIVIKNKNQDFTIGKPIYYQFSSEEDFIQAKTVKGKIFLAALAAECKVNLDKTMFQECAGTATRLKQGCPVSKYYVLVEYLDMEPEDVRLTDIDNVFLLRKVKRLPPAKRNDYNEVKAQHKNFPISDEVVANFTREIQHFINAVWYDSDEALKRGSFV